jgi:hypothetical protein
VLKNSFLAVFQLRVFAEQKLVALAIPAIHGGRFAQGIVDSPVRP